MPAPSRLLLHQIEEMFDDSRASVNVHWNNDSFLETRLGELMREHDAHTVIAGLLFNYFVLHTQLRHTIVDKKVPNDD